MTRYVVAVTAVVLVLAAGCGEPTGRATDPAPGAPAGSGIAGVELVPEEQADLHLWACRSPPTRAPRARPATR